VGVGGGRPRVAQSLQAASVGDTQDPGRHPRGAPKVAGVLPDDPESVIDDLLRELVPRRQPHEKPRQPAVIEEIELLHRGAVAGGDAVEERTFALLVRAAVAGSGVLFCRHHHILRLVRARRRGNSRHARLYPVKLRGFTPREGPQKRQRTVAETRPPAESGPKRRTARGAVWK